MEYFFFLITRQNSVQKTSFHILDEGIIYIIYIVYIIYIIYIIDIIYIIYIMYMCICAPSWADANYAPFITNLNSEVRVREDEGTGKTVLKFAGYDDDTTAPYNTITYQTSIAPSTAADMFDVTGKQSQVNGVAVCKFAHACKNSRVCGCLDEKQDIHVSWRGHDANSLC